MRFWDSSAVVPLICDEEVSSKALALYRQDTQVLVWALTATEVISALCRRFRDGSMSRLEFRKSRQALQLLGKDWTEVQALELVRERAHRLLEIHPLRTADALQLGSALVATEDRPHGFGMVAFDAALADAAEKEGFTVIP